ncbi:MAG: AAA family ATPase, partial [Pseudomonadales bacterium]|nr:AAA family ATPase [Pseudomonadales bacterium]
MRLLDFRLDKFGPFTDHVLDLKEEGVHVIFGPNEAGKSSTLRAIIHFLYGFPTRTSDDHVHLQRSLRVGAKVQQGDSTASEDNAVILYRKKGNKDTLRDESDKAVESATLTNLLHNLQKDQFENFFGLDNKTLDEGGEDLIKGNGNLGEALFSASMGGQQFQQLLKELDARQGQLFKNTGTNPKLNAAFKVLSEAEKQHKAHCLKSTEWEKAQRAVGDATEVLTSVEALHKDTYLERERLERINRTLPNLSSRKAIVSKLAEIEEVRTLPADSTETRLSAIKDINRCEPSIDALSEAIQSMGDALEGLTINEAVLAQDVAIDALKNEKALYQKNVTDYQLILGEVTERKNAIETIVATILP